MELPAAFSQRITKDGAQVACGFGTVYEAIEKIGICGNDAVLVTGLPREEVLTALLSLELMDLIEEKSRYYYRK